MKASYLTAVLLGFSLQAQMAGALEPNRLTPWTDESFRECEFWCLYEKANETLILRAKYTLNKVESMMDLERKGEKDRVIANLEGFCTVDEKKNQDAAQCLRRYKAFERENLAQIRSAMIKNSDSVAQLRGSTRGMEPASAIQKGTLEFGRPELPKRPQVPYVVTYSDLEKTYDGSLELRSFGLPQYEEWLKTMPREPKPEDFVHMKTIPRYPEAPNGERIVVIDTDRAGRPIQDNEGFKAALARYNNDLGKSYATAEKAGLIKAFGSLGDPRRKFASLVESESRDAFAQARMDMLDVANREIIDSGIAVGQRPSDPTRLPATAPGAQPDVSVGANVGGGSSPSRGALAERRIDEKVLEVVPAPEAKNILLIMTPQRLDSEITRVFGY